MRDEEATKSPNRAEKSEARRGRLEQEAYLIAPRGHSEWEASTSHLGLTPLIYEIEIGL